MDIQQRIREVSQRLLNWPNVSGAKPLRRQWKGCFRLRTGDWRMIFRPAGDELVVLRIANRRDVYED